MRCAPKQILKWVKFAAKYKARAGKVSKGRAEAVLLRAEANPQVLEDFLDELMQNPGIASLLEISAVAFRAGKTRELEEFVLQNQRLFTDDYRNFFLLLEGRAHEAYKHRRDVVLNRKYKYLWKNIRNLSPGDARKLPGDGICVLTYGGLGGEIAPLVAYGELDKYATSHPEKRLAPLCDWRLHGILSRTFTHLDFIPVRRLYPEIVSFRALLGHMPDYCRLPHPGMCRVLDNEAFGRLDAFDHVVPVDDVVLSFWDEFHASDTPPVLQADEKLVTHFAKTLPPGRKVGIVPASLNANPVRQTDNFGPQELDTLFRKADCTFINLQYRGKIEGYDNVITPDFDRMNDLERLLALLKNLDYVISPDTATAKLAAMAGVPVLMITNGLFHKCQGHQGRHVLMPNTFIMHSDTAADMPDTLDRIISIINGTEPAAA